MRDILQALQRGDHREALVRLWIRGTRRQNPDDDLPLNAWERRSSRPTRLSQRGDIRNALNAGRPLEIDAGVDPLAVIVALDTFLGLDTVPKTFAPRPYDVDGREYWLLPHNVTRANAASSARQAGNPQAWFRHHRVVPATLASGLRIQPQPSRDMTATRLREITVAGRLRAFLRHFDDAVRLVPQPADRFFATGLSDEAARAARVDRAVSKAIQETRTSSCCQNSP